MWMRLGVDGERVVSRRSFFETGMAGAIGWKAAVMANARELQKQGKSCILLFMTGGPSQLETFDPKPGVKNGGPTEKIGTAVSSIDIATGWEKTAAQMKHIALVRSMTNNVAEHTRAQYHLHTGYIPAGGVKFPTLGSTVSSQLPPPPGDLPSFVSIGTPGNTIGSGFLGMSHAPFTVNDPSRMPNNAVRGPGVNDSRFGGRLDLLGDLEKEYARNGAKEKVEDHQAIYANAARLVRSPKLESFDISKEKDGLQEKYGKTPFGRGCLLARRLVEQGVPFVEVESRDWDTHFDHFERIKPLNSAVDAGFSALVEDLHQRGLLEKTLVIWMGEFGRTPLINPRTGRDHYPRAFSIALAGGGIRGGQVIGETSSDGMAVKSRPVTVPDLFCSFCHSLGISARRENPGPLNRPVKIVDGGQVVKELF
ncbi:MAG: DUF1501 domain-containing protein [Gemmataceae bacterium]|nr:DUF1501 domain-containing protein [Gemmataceae bacterium]